MNLQTKLLISILLPALSACSTQITQVERNTSPAPIDSEITIEAIDQKTPISVGKTTLIKSGKVLSLVRIMEGGACKNKQQGAMGLFGLYANKEDITRIKKTQGSGIFSDFEQQIQSFSMLAVNSAIQQLDFQNNADQSQLSIKLTRLFAKLIADKIAEFEINTTLSIDVAPIKDSLVFSLDKCDLPHGH